MVRNYLNSQFLTITGQNGSRRGSNAWNDQPPIKEGLSFRLTGRGCFGCFLVALNAALGQSVDRGF